jgi:hypothetical protein
MPWLDPIALKLSAAIGTFAAIAQTALPNGGTEFEHIWERLGVAGLLVAGAYFMIRYFMGVVSAKDQQIHTLFEEHRAEANRNTAMLIQHLEKGYEVQRHTAAAVQELTVVVRELRDRR